MDQNASTPNRRCPRLDLVSFTTYKKGELREISPFVAGSSPTLATFLMCDVCIEVDRSIGSLQRPRFGANHRTLLPTIFSQ